MGADPPKNLSYIQLSAMVVARTIVEAAWHMQITTTGPLSQSSGENGGGQSHKRPTAHTAGSTHRRQP